MAPNSPTRLPGRAPTARNPEELIVLRLSEAEIESADLERLRFLLAPSPQGRALQRLQNCVCLLFPSDYAEAFSNPAVRRFSRALFDAFPGCAYFLSLGDAALWKLTMGLMDTLSIVERRAQPRRIRLHLEGSALAGVVQRHIDHACEVARRAGADTMQEEDLQLGIWAYFRRASAAYNDGTSAI